MGVADQFVGIAPGRDRAGLGVQKDAVAGNGKNAGQFVGDNDESGAQGVPQFQNQIVQQT